MHSESIESHRPAAVHTLNEDPYLDIIDVGVLLDRPPYEIGWLAEVGFIPAHALRHEGQTCWKFRLSEVRAWAEEIGIEISQQAIRGLLSSGSRAQ